MILLITIIRAREGTTVQTKTLTRSRAVVAELISPLLPVRVCVFSTVAGLTDAGEAHQEMMSDQSDIQNFNTSFIGLTNREGGNLPVSDPPLEADYEVLPDLGAPERGHRFFEGRRLLLRG